MSDYLWDKSGDDPEVERLELALAPLAYRGAPPRLPRRSPVLIYAGIATVAAALLLLLWPRPVPTGWTLDGHAVAAGEWLESGPLVSDLGRVQIQPGTRLRVIGHGRLELDHGGLEAQIAAAPRRFSVIAHGTVVTDLGCAFQLTVDAEGAGRLLVSEGRVALSQGGREVIVSAGAECGFTPDGPGTPHEIETPKKLELPAHEIEPREAAQPKPAPQKLTQPRPQKLHVEQPHVAPQQKDPKKAPAQNDPGLKLQHDSLKDLDRSL